MTRESGIALLGPVEVVGPVGPVALGGERRATLLAVLAARAGEVVSIDALVDELWGAQPPRTARASLQSHVSRLRQVLEVCPDLEIRGEPGGYVLRDAGRAVDVARMEEASRRAAERLEDDPAAALAAADEALGAWRGDPLGGTRPGPQLQALAARLEELHAQLLERRCEALVALGRHEEAAAELAQHVVDHPLREGLWVLLMRTQYLLGRQGDALSTYHSARFALAQHAGLEPGPALERQHADVLNHRVIGTATPAAPVEVAGNLPATTTSFHDREDELVAIRELLSSHRLVTLTGAGGSGKTRLALEYGHRADDTPGGVWMTDLLTIRDPDAVPTAIAATVGIPDLGPASLADDLTAHLAETAALLLLDNCEHVLDSVAALLSRLLTTCPELRVLATSREPIRIEGEALLRVDPLPVPDDDATRATISASPAVRLLVDRAVALRPELTLDEATAPDLRDVVRRLDGLPLALELAAARLRAMSPREVADRLDDRFRLLTDDRATTTDGRTRTLAATIDWSHDLLDPVEQVVFRRLAVFEGGFGLAAAESVVALDDLDATDVVDALTGLVDRSLVTVGQGPDGRSRYGLLETLHRYARKRLDETDETDALADAHARHHLAMAGSLLPMINTDEQAVAVETLRAELDNLRSALDRAVARGDVQLAVGLLTTLWPFWFRFGQAGEGIRWIRRIRSTAGDDLPAELRAEFLAAAGNLAWLQGDNSSAWAASSTAHELARTSGDDRVLALSRMIMGMCRYREGDTATATAWLDEAHEHAEAANHTWLRGTTAVLGGFVRRDADALGDAEARFTRALAVFADAGDAWGVSLARHGLGTLRLRTGELDEAAAAFAAALPPVAELGELQGVGCNAAAIGALLVARGDLTEGAVLLAAADAIFDRISEVRNTLVQDPMADALDVLENELADARRDELRARGVSLSVPEIVASALRWIEDDGLRHPGRGESDERARSRVVNPPEDI